MKVVFVINDLSGGGAEKVLQLLTAYLACRGHEVTVVTLHGGHHAYELDRAVRKISLKPNWFTRRAGRIAALPVQARKLSALLRELQPDICVGNLPRANMALLLTRWFGYQSVALVTEHAHTWDAYPSSRVRDRVMRWLISRFYHRADGAITVSQGVGDGLLDFGVRKEQIHVLHNPIELALIRTQARLAPPAFPTSDLPTMITIGRHTKIKDHETLIRAFAMVRRRVPARLLFVGQGPLQSKLQTLVRELDLSNFVVFAGWQDNPFAWLARSDLFVLSSRFEGFGNVIVEAMACGLPVISTDCRCGPREILRNGDDGVLAPVGDVEALADAMITLLTNHELRRELAEKSLRRACDFDISIIGAQYEALLHSFVRRKSAALA